MWSKAYLRLLWSILHQSKKLKKIMKTGFWTSWVLILCKWYFLNFLHILTFISILEYSRYCFFLSSRVQRAKFKGFKHWLLSLGITGPNLPLRCFKDPMGESIPFLLLEKHTNIIWFIIYWVWRQEAFRGFMFLC